MEALQTGIQNFLRELDHLGTVLISSPAGWSLTCWFLSVLASVGAIEIARRQTRRKHLELAANVTDEPMFSWFPDGPDKGMEPL